MMGMEYEPFALNSISMGQVETRQVGGKVETFVELRVTVPNTAPETAVQVKTLTDRVTDHFVRSVEGHREKWAKERARLEDERKRIQHAVAQARTEEEARMRQVEQETGLSREDNRGVDVAARDEVDELLAIQAGAVARREALERAIHLATDRVADRVKNDSVAAELRKVVEVREEIAKRAAQVGPNGRPDLERAVAVAEARARLAEREQAAFAAAGGDQVDQWRRELLDLDVATAERAGRIDHLKDRNARRRTMAERLHAVQAQSGRSVNAFNLNAELNALDTRLMLANAQVATNPAVRITESWDRVVAP